MRKFLLISLLALCTLTVKAQENNLLKHWAVGISAGTTGVGFDVATTLNQHLQFRGVFNFFPKVSANSDLEISGMPDIPEGYTVPDDIKVEGKLNMNSADLLLDVFPSKRSSFHFTLGLSCGFGKGIAELYNLSGQEDLRQIYEYNQRGDIYKKVGYGLGHYLLEPDADGRLYADIRVKKLKPYVGIGFGRAVPRSKRVGVMFEVGARFWGSPSVYCNQVRLDEENIGGEEGKIFKTISEICVYPVMRLRLCGRFL